MCRLVYCVYVGLVASLWADRDLYTDACTVFVAGQTIGGGDDTAALSAAGKLKPMLQSAGAL